ncbi:MAG: hypothetical protein ACXVGO_09485, partial [Mycobacterium sp.]
TLSTRAVCCTINFLRESDATISDLRQRVNEPEIEHAVRVREWCEKHPCYHWPKGEAPPADRAIVYPITGEA